MPDVAVALPQLHLLHHRVRPRHRAARSEHTTSQSRTPRLAGRLLSHRRKRLGRGRERLRLGSSVNLMGRVPSSVRPRPAGHWKLRPVRRDDPRMAVNGRQTGRGGAPREFETLLAWSVPKKFWGEKSVRLRVLQVRGAGGAMLDGMASRRRVCRLGKYGRDRNKAPRTARRAPSIQPGQSCYKKKKGQSACICVETL